MALEVKNTQRLLPSSLAPDQAAELFEREARRLADMSGAEFITRWDAGEYRDRDLDATPEGRKIAYLALLIPFGRRHP
jgi:hypothetical protein